MKSEDDLTEQLANEATLSPVNTEPCLLVLTGSSAGQLFVLKKCLTTMGRATDADVVLNDRGISRYHARLDRTADGEMRLLDLDSTNGTFVGGASVTSTSLKEGDRVGLGPHATLLVVHRETLEELESRLQDSDELNTESVGRLAAGMAHELNSPLSAICLAVEAAEYQMSSRPDAAARKLQSALQAAERAGEIVRQLMFYAGRTKGGVAPIDINGSVSRAARRQKGKVVLSLGEAMSTIARENELNELLDNLLGNAFDAGASEGGILLSTRRETDWCIITIEDDGEGIAEEDVSRIFEPFFTTRNTSRKGLGLSVCQQIVARHEGELRVRSEKGKGSVFEIWLPAKDR
jgi:two-component system NtrC family sensor kinase